MFLALGLGNEKTNSPTPCVSRKNPPLLESSSINIYEKLGVYGQLVAIG